jgi:FtsZ-binding cell division protein ZapB
MTASVKEYWPHMLDSEEKALHRAVEYYNTAFDKSTVLRTVKDEVNVLQLIARIHIKLGEYHDALRLLQMSIDKARREKQRLDEELRMPRREGEELTAEKSGKMVSDSRRFSNLADTGQSLFEKVRQEWFKAHAEKGRKIMAEHPGAPPEEMRQHLQAANIDRRVIDRIAPEPKKKGLFGIFK